MYPDLRRNTAGQLYLTTTTGGRSYGKDIYQKCFNGEYYPWVAVGHIDTKWFDTTWCEPKFELPKKYIINDKVCVLVWKDGETTKIKKSEDDEFDPVKAFLWAWFQHTCDLPKWKANKYLAEVEENCINNITKKKPKKKKEVVEEL